MMKLFQLIFVIALAACSSFFPASARPIKRDTTNGMPRPENLLGFWPLTQKHGLADVGANSLKAADNTNVMYVTGPFGQDYTAVKSLTGVGAILDVQNEKLSVSEKKAFTVALFFKIEGKTSGGIFEFLAKAGSKSTLQFRYSDPTMMELGANGAVIGKFPLIQKDAWTFIAMTCNVQNFTMYTRHGVFLPPGFKPQLIKSLQYNNGGIKLGFANRWGALPANDAVSCLSVYDSELTGNEIRQVYEACRAIHEAPACGIAKLPNLPQLATDKTVIPEEGEFPWLASLSKDGKVVCSASIVDAYWLLTASSCFPDGSSTTASQFVVQISEHDALHRGINQEEHKVAKIIVNPGGIALVQVEEPIEFRSDFVNDACLDLKGTLLSANGDSTAFVHGWGSNGRPEGKSAGLPRYVPGNILADDVCQAAWGTDFVAATDRCFLSASDDKNIPCQGDEGAPVHVSSGAGLVQVGIYHKRDAGCSAEKPGLFVKLEPYAKWIAEQLACSSPGVAYPATCPQ